MAGLGRFADFQWSRFGSLRSSAQRRPNHQLLGLIDVAGARGLGRFPFEVRKTE
jgi:hypothetical protein